MYVYVITDPNGQHGRAPGKTMPQATDSLRQLVLGIDSFVDAVVENGLANNQSPHQAVAEFCPVQFLADHGFTVALSRVA